MSWFSDGLGRIKNAIHSVRIWKHNYQTDGQMPTEAGQPPNYQSNWKLTAAEALTVTAYLAQLGGAAYILAAGEYENKAEKGLVIGHLVGDVTLLALKTYIAVKMHGEHNYFVTEKKHHQVVDASMALNFVMTLLGVGHAAAVDSVFGKFVAAGNGLAAGADYLIANYLHNHPHPENPARIAADARRGGESRPSLGVV